MGSPVNVDKTYTGTGAQKAILLNRWSRDDYSLAVDISATATYTIQATFAYVNRVETTDDDWFQLLGFVDLTADTTTTIQQTPLEAIRLNISANTGDIRFQLVQQGEG